MELHAKSWRDKCKLIQVLNLPIQLHVEVVDVTHALSQKIVPLVVQF